MYGQHFQHIIDQSGMVANPARGQLNRENIFLFLSPFAPENLVSRDGFYHPVPCQVRTFSTPRLNLLLLLLMLLARAVPLIFIFLSIFVPTKNIPRPLAE